MYILIIICIKTGYGVGFPKNSMWIPKFNEYLMRYRENGDLERMQRFWFTGACEPRKRRRTSSKPLALAQVTIICTVAVWTPLLIRPQGSQGCQKIFFFTNETVFLLR